MNNFQIATTSSRERFTNYFGNDLGMLLFRFYRSNIDMGGVSGSQKKIKISERRFRNAKYLVDNYGEKAIVKAMDLFKHKLETGVLSQKSLPYFEALVKSFSVKKSAEMVIREDVVPIKTYKVYDHYDKELLNWYYKCPKCGYNDIDAWNETCPECGVLFNWSGVGAFNGS